ncbi:cellobiose transport system substrate-binding protein [Actinopolymorpha cephalotaxi]|uniref:Cellobiose transport system substrate-binding protein n=1 Tax=Actinopolymorpha cephalotaxi TaxID=504797 RepID=A0A1I2U9Z4_9ACTN|nr:extracellular solute-binding protein [Actinopolymorpha cephalotaxi]NYH86501.1 cellobiose transport system substrate-binding protein [Actinopolymorpha cephalotaxi]SFG73918.1 cellobiose transport system substrate-binding protein [Actinopolymorpha cephalotaxi]
MAPNRRTFLAAASGLLGTALLGTSGCGARGSYLTPEGTISLWYWNRSISDTLLAKTPKATGVRLVPQKIGGDFKSKFLTSLAGKAYIPDIVGLNEDVATYFPDADQFVDLFDVGAKDVESEFLDWKWQRGVTPDGRMVGFPMDTGPTALFYRADLFEKAGLPSEPDQVAQAMDTWEKYLEAGSTLVKKMPKKTYMMPNVDMVYNQALAQQGKRYMDEKNKFIGDGPQVREPWDLAVDAYRRRITSNTNDWTSDWNAAMSTGRVASFVGAVWMGQVLTDAASGTAGKWRVCRAPGGAGNSGGSFLGIPKSCRDPEAAFKVIRYLQSPENQVVYGLNEMQLYPSAIAAIDDRRAQVKDKFYGGQVINEVFGTSAKAVKPVYLSPYDNVVGPAFSDQITNIWSAGKNPDRAWKDALTEADRQLSHLGLI